jgi:UDP-glucose 6-dehydrogenase
MAHKNEFPVSDRELTLVFVEADTMSLKIEEADANLLNIQAEIQEINDDLRILIGKQSVAHGINEQLRGEFWKKVRKENPEFMRRAISNGMIVRFERAILPETGQTVVKVVAFDPNAEEVLRYNNRIKEAREQNGQAPEEGDE